MLERVEALVHGQRSVGVDPDAKRARALQEHDVGEVEPLHDGSEDALRAKARVLRVAPHLGVRAKTCPVGVGDDGARKVGGELADDLVRTRETDVEARARKDHGDVASQDDVRFERAKELHVVHGGPFTTV